MSLKYVTTGILFWVGVAALLFSVRPRSLCHKIRVDKMGKIQNITAFVVMLSVILLCILPMGLSPPWNGEIPEHRNQYEVLAESILSGHVYLDYGDMDPRLLEMENPYDFAARTELSINCHWDHAFYDGNYYMYFGVVPVLLLFLPYRVLTGNSLTTYHATQVFTALFICGVFAIFYMLAKKFFPKITFGIYLVFASAISIMSIWYSISTPALYCTAITAGLCMGIWSLFFFMRAVWVESEEKRSIFFAFWGSLLGALAFGCRPTVALANLLTIPLLVSFLRKRKLSIRLMLRLAVAASPYLIVGISLMVYNYVRFHNPFEFGQTYQLTNADQSMYGNMLERFDIVTAINSILENFISYQDISWSFPYISHNGALVNFPLLMFPFAILVQAELRGRMKKAGIWSFVLLLVFMPIIITIMTSLWTPGLKERYRQDIYWLMGLLTFLSIGFYIENAQEYVKEKYSFLLCMAGLAVIGTCFFLFLVPNDLNYTAFYPEMLDNIRRMLKFGIGM